MKSYIRAACGLVLANAVALVNLQGCHRADPANETTPAGEALAEDADTPDVPTVPTRCDFGVDLYQQLAREHPGQNLFFSPYSVSGVLTIAAQGARGETAVQMGKVLHFREAARQTDDSADSVPWDLALIHSVQSKLNERFRPRAVPQKERDQIASLRDDLEAAERQVSQFTQGGSSRRARDAHSKAEKLAADLNALLARVDQYEIRIANGLWGEQTYPFEPSFLDTIRQFYGSGVVFPADFKNEADSARQQINAWVAEQTSGRIRDLIPPKRVNELTRLVLTNAIYFKGEWLAPFPVNSTRQDDFTISDGTKARVPMMNEQHRRDVQYAAFNADGTYFATPGEVLAQQAPDPKLVYPGQDGCLMLDVPYKGGELSMVVIVPQSAAGLEELEKKLTGDGLSQWIGKLQRRNVHVYLPKFKLETDYSLKPTLIALGMSRAFEKPSSPRGAQFEGMCASQDPKQRLFITEVLHKAFLEVNEKGTEAAAATALPMGVEDGEFEPPKTVPFTPTFRADKPFLFLIRDRLTGTVLFFGRMVHPQSLD